MKATLLTAAFACFLFSCKKEKGTDTGTSPDETTEILTTETNGNCPGFTALGDNGDGTYTAQYGPAVVTLSTPYYQVYCDNNDVITLQNGLPAWSSSFNATVNSSVIYGPSSPNTSNQFAIVSGTTITNWTIYDDSMSSFLTKWNKFRSDLNNDSIPYAQRAKQPYISDFIKPISGNSTTAGLVFTYGKLIRVTTGSNFALAPLCYNEPNPCMFEIIE